VASWTVHATTDPAVLQQLHDLAVSWFDPSAVCSPGAWWPSMGELTRYVARGGSVYYATNPQGQIAGFALVAADGRIDWLKGAGAAGAGVALARMAAKIIADCGQCYGTVRNAALRAALVAAGGGRVVDDGPATCRVWVKP
jgi:hypothetical protein